MKSIESPESEYLGDASECVSGLVCEHCGSDSLTLIDEIDKPSWTDVFRTSNEACPNWCRESLDLDDRRFWDVAIYWARLGHAISMLDRGVVDGVSGGPRAGSSRRQSQRPSPSVTPSHSSSPPQRSH